MPDSVPTPVPIPWYRQFWPWFLIALPGSAVIASFALLTVALRNADSLVRSDWSHHGYNINADIERQRAAARLGIEASMVLDGNGRGLTAIVSGPPLAADSLELQLQHPTHAERDVHVQLAAAGDNRFVATTAVRVDGTWDATLTSPEADWKIQRRLWLTSMKPASLAPPAALRP